MNNDLFELPIPEAKPRTKKAKLGRYERLQELSRHDDDPNKIWVPVDHGGRAPSGRFAFVDLFSGAGGMSYGMKMAGFVPRVSVELVEIASATHRRNFPGCKHFCGDIRDFATKEWLIDKEIEDVHLVVGGPPCQGFSVAGKRDPTDPRNKLFREFVRVVSEIKPWYVVMENVPGILTMQQGAVRNAIIEAFQEVGYKSVSVAVLESAAYGVAQIRPRAIFIANRFGLPNPFPDPIYKVSEFAAIESVIEDLPAWDTIPEINHEWTRHSKQFMERIAKVPPGGSLYQSYFDAFKRQYPNLPSMTIKENHGGTHIHPSLDRCISAREMARLQSFPDSFVFEGSMKKAMWQIGNAVPPRLAEVIGLALVPLFLHLADKTPLEAAYSRRPERSQRLL